MRLVPLTDEEIKTICYGLSQVTYEAMSGEMILELNAQREKLQACLKGEEGLDESEIGIISRWFLKMDDYDRASLRSGVIQEKLKSYLGE